MRSHGKLWKSEWPKTCNWLYLRIFVSFHGRLVRRALVFVRREFGAIQFPSWRIDFDGRHRTRHQSIAMTSDRTIRGNKQNNNQSISRCEHLSNYANKRKPSAEQDERFIFFLWRSDSQNQIIWFGSNALLCEECFSMSRLPTPPHYHIQSKFFAFHTLNKKVLVHCNYISAVANQTFSNTQYQEKKKFSPNQIDFNGVRNCLHEWMVKRSLLVADWPK